MSPKKSGLSGLTEAHTTDRQSDATRPLSGGTSPVCPAAGDPPAPRGHLPFPGAPARPRARLRPCVRQDPGGSPGAPFVLFTPEQPRGQARSPSGAGASCPGRGAAGPARPHASLRGLSRTRPPAAAASIINGDSGVQRLPPRETLPGAVGASLPAPREPWMRRRFPVTAMPGGGAGGAAAVPPLPPLQWVMLPGAAAGAERRRATADPPPAAAGAAALPRPVGGEAAGPGPAGAAAACRRARGTRRRWRRRRLALPPCCGGTRCPRTSWSASSSRATGGCTARRRSA